MKKKYLILTLISILFLLTLTTVCAADNNTEIQSVNDDSGLNAQINDKLESGSSYSSSSDSSSSSSSSSESGSESGYVLDDTSESSGSIYDDEYFDDEDLEDDDDYSDDETSEYDGEFQVENITIKYDGYGEVTVYLVDNDGNPLILGDDAVSLHWSDGTVTKLYDNDMVNLEILADEINYGIVDPDVYDYWLNVDDEYYWEGYSIFTWKPVGTYTVTAVCDDDYNIKPATFTLKITKGSVKLTPKVYHSASGDYATLKCTVKDSYGQYVDEGTVTFKINGKSYKVKVQDGVATKKVKLTKAKTYKYTATFNGDNYYSKSASNKVYVYKTTKKARTFKIGKYKVVVPLAKYKKLINAKNTNKLVSYSFYTGKKITQKVKINGKWKTKKKVKVYISIEYGGKTGGQNGVANKYSIFAYTYYQSPGYDGCKPWLSGYKSRALISGF